MSGVTIRPYTPADGPQVFDLELQYAKAFPGAAVVSADVYGHPAFEQGQNILCALDAQGRLLGYAPLFPQPVLDGPGDLPHVIWTDVKVDPTREDSVSLKDALLEQVVQRAHQIAATLPPRKLELRLDYASSEEPSIAYALARGFTHYRSVYQMERELAEPIRDLPAPEGVAVRAWKMETEGEQEAYLQARNQAFPEAPWDRDGLRYFMGAPFWATGTTYTAFAADEVVGSVMAYWNAAENHRTGRSLGFTEDIFVTPAWRKRGLARCLIAQGLLYLRRHGLATAHLQVATSNAHALTLYESLRYKPVQQNLLLKREL